VAEASIKLLRRASYAAVVYALTACGGAPNVSEIDSLRPQIAARQSTVKQMKSEGICSENSSGSLARSANPSNPISVVYRTIIDQENYDRERAFDAIARAYKLSSSDIKSLFYEMQQGQ
jgi:hypothetical protein